MSTAGVTQRPAGPSSPLRIGLYTSSLAHSHRKPPGVDVFVERLAEQLVLAGHDVTMITYSPAAEARSYATCQLRPEATATSRLRRMLLAPARLNRLDTDRLDLLHLHGDDWFYLNRRVPTLRTFHGSALYEARFATRARRRMSQYATYGLEVLASRLATAAYGVIPDDGPGYATVGHLPLAVDLPSAIEYGRVDPPTVLFVGTWAGRKRGAMLHDAFTREVRPRIPDARLVMVSDRCEPAPGIEWLARPSDEELIALYRSAWVFCLPSSYEGFGLPYLEAMANGAPVLAASNPGSRFVLDGGRYGVIAEDNDLGAKLSWLLVDSNARQQFAREGRKRAEQFGWAAPRAEARRLGTACCRACRAHPPAAA
jgi:phosphatidyl-myo-inositol alpha-mannosyltransferase